MMAVDVQALSVSYRETPVLKDVSLAVPAGALMAIVGPNGAGKTTLLKAMLGLIPSTGRVLICGQPSDQNRLRVAYVPQKSSVDWDFPTTVGELVLMGTYGQLGWWKRPSAVQRTAVAEALAQVKMTDYRERQIGQLSGGQQQRAFLARALVQHADVYFLDEPFQGVDAVTEQDVVKLLQSLRDDGKTLLVVHHDLQTVPIYFDRVTLLNRRVIASGPIAEAFTPDLVQRAYMG
jgi:manganese/zinc/iron transport system ATP- binding protein